MLRTRLTRGLVVLLGSLAVGGCDVSVPPDGEGEVVSVWFSRVEEPVAVHRVVHEAPPIYGALRALLAGPTPAEREAGLSSWFSESTRDALRRLRHEEGHVVVDFGDLPALIPGAGTSAGSEQLLTALDSTIFQFDWVRTLEYRLDGSCDAFWEWLQRACTIVERP